MHTFLLVGTTINLGKSSRNRDPSMLSRPWFLVRTFSLQPTGNVLTIYNLETFVLKHLSSMSNVWYLNFAKYHVFIIQINDIVPI